MFERIEIDWKRVKRNMKVELAATAVGLLLLTSCLLGVLIIVGTLFNLEKYNHPWYEWVIAFLGVFVLAWIIGTWFLELLRIVFFPKQSPTEEMSSKED